MACEEEKFLRSKDRGGTGFCEGSRRQERAELITTDSLLNRLTCGSMKGR
jgi:hypothetical protein